jgi:hypothetical protein
VLTRQPQLVSERGVHRLVRELRRAARATPDGIESMDLVLDMFVLPDGSWSWKDREDFDRAVDDGVLEPHLPALFETEAQRVLTEHAAGQAAFDPAWIDWRPPWQLPTAQLPAPFRVGGSRW